MKKKKSWKFYVGIAILVVTIIHILNRIIFALSGKENMLFSSNSSRYKWRFGDIFFTKQGNGTPVLLIHDLNPAASDVEYRYMIKELTQNHTVFTLDLLGCGRSDKPSMVYTSYIYVQLIHDFIRDVVKDSVNLVVSGYSVNLAFLAAYNDSNQIRSIHVINPADIRKNNQIPFCMTKLASRIICLPVIGTFLYNIVFSQYMIQHRMTKSAYQPYSIKSKVIKAYYEAAHMYGMDCKYLYASIVSRYTNSNALHAIVNCKVPVTILVGEEEENGPDTVNMYADYNPEIKIQIISKTGHYPQLERPAVTAQYLKLL